MTDRNVCPTNSGFALLALEVLYGTFMFFSGSAGLKSPEVSALSSLRIFLL